MLNDNICPDAGHSLIDILGPADLACLASPRQIHLVFQHNGAAYLIFLPPHFSTITAVSAWHYMHITRYKFEKLRRNKFRIYAKAVDIICLLSHPLGCISPWCSQHRAATQCMAAADSILCVMQSLAAGDHSLSSAAQIIAVLYFSCYSWDYFACNKWKACIQI